MVPVPIDTRISALTIRKPLMLSQFKKRAANTLTYKKEEKYFSLLQTFSIKAVPNLYHYPDCVSRALLLSASYKLRLLFR